MVEDFKIQNQCFHKSLLLIVRFQIIIFNKICFLIILLLETVTSTSATTRGLSDDDEAFLRAILSNQASVSTTPSSAETNPAALLALLLKQQGIEPTTPATKLREQLQLSVSIFPLVRMF